MDFNDDNILCAYLHGSRVYGTASENSDTDYILVVKNNPYGTDTISEGNTDYNLYTEEEWQKMAQEGHVDYYECIFLPPEYKYKETIPPKLPVKKSDVRRVFSQTASNSWVKCKKKLTVEKDFAPYIAKKSLWHSFRLLTFGCQIMKDGKITDYTAANQWYKEMVENPSNDYAIYKETYQPLYNKLKSKFRSYDHLEEKTQNEMPLKEQLKAYKKQCKTEIQNSDQELQEER